MRIALLCLVLAFGCGDDDGGADAAAGLDAPTIDAPGTDAPGEDAETPDSGDDAGSDAGPMGPNVDRSDPMLWEHELEPDALDDSVVDNIETQYAQLDTRVDPIGKPGVLSARSQQHPAQLARPRANVGELWIPRGDPALQQPVGIGVLRYGRRVQREHAVGSSDGRRPVVGDRSESRGQCRRSSHRDA